MNLKHFFKAVKANWWIFLIMALALITRVLFLDRVPTAMSFDELEYILNAKSFFLTGKDMTHTVSLIDPFLFRYPPGILPQAELPYLLLYPIVGLTKFSLFTARITFALLSVGTVILFYYLGRELIDRKTGLVAAAVAALNPWFIFIGRTSYEMVPAMFFYLLGLWILLKSKGWMILSSFPIFVLAFYSYIGTKVFFLPFIFCIVLYAYFVINKRKYLRQYILLCVLSLLVLVGFFILLHASNGSRFSEILTPFSPQIAEQVDAIRKVSLASPLSALFENKITIFLRIIGIKLFDSLSPSYLFATGDIFFSLFRHGLFYVVDSLFAVLGILWLLRKNRWLLLFLGTVFLLGFAPQVIHSSGFGNATPHITMIFPPMIIFIACGIVALVDWFSRLWLRRIKIGIAAVGVVYFLSFLNFVSIYLFQYPVGGYFDFPMRTLSRYASLSSKEDMVFIATPQQKGKFRKHIFYANLYQTSTSYQIGLALKEQVPSIAGVSFVPCNKDEKVFMQQGVYIVDSMCGEGNVVSHKAITQLKDGGAVYRIYNDSLCKDFELKSYPVNLKLSDFEVETLSVREFCEVFISSR